MINKKDFEYQSPLLEEMDLKNLVLGAEGEPEGGFSPSIEEETPGEEEEAD